CAPVGPDVVELPVVPLAPVGPLSSCWMNGSLERKSPKASSWPDAGVGTASGSVRPSPPGAEAVWAVALPPASAGAAIGPLVAGVVTAGVELELVELSSAG